MNNLFSSLPDHLPQELVETLLETESLRIERIVSRGHTSPTDDWYDQRQHEWVILLRGAAELRFEADPETRRLQAGDYLNIPAGARHRVEWTHPDQPTIWLAIHYRGG